MQEERLLILQNIKQLLTMEPEYSSTQKEPEETGLIENGAVVIRNETIEWIGSDRDLPDTYKSGTENATFFNLENKVVTPGLIEAHTHLVFGGSREKEFEMRIEGATYEEILHEGGGIHSTVEATRTASEEELLESAYKRADTFMSFGITTLEIKSGYGLDTETELKMLKIADKLHAIHPIEIVTTFLGAHVIPKDHKTKRNDYVELIIKEMLPRVSEETRASFCDVFVEKGAFTVEEAEKILGAGSEYGLRPKLHSDQFNSIGGIRLAVDLNAASIDHCDAITEQDIALLSGKEIPVVLLPGAVFFLSSQRYAPARTMIEKGIPVALSTDFNPGSSMTENLPLIMSIACLRMKMLPHETIMAVTKTASKSLETDEITGSLKPGKQADIAVFDVPDYRYIPYNMGMNNCKTVIKNGEIVYNR